MCGIQRMTSRIPDSVRNDFNNLLLENASDGCYNEQVDEKLRRSGGEGMEHTAEAAMIRRGHLKIFFGYAVGSGKTHAMLAAAQTARQKNVDVIAGVVEVHSGTEDAALFSALERLPMRVCGQDGRREFDPDAALRRRPQLILVDDLAHRNAPGCRNSMRYQDVEELLKAGVDVYTTVDVQNIESLNDTVASITGRVVSERIPDFVFDQADQVELVDIEPSELIERMSVGGAVDGEALSGLYTPDKLTALRELALRRCADRANRIVGARMRQRSEYRADEHILVCLSSAPSNAKIIRTAARMAGAFHSSFTALYVETPGFAAMADEDRARLRANIRLAQQLGASIETVCGDDVPYQIAEFARLSGVSRIVLGRSAAASNRLFRKPTLTDRLIATAPNIDIHIIPDGAPSRPYRPPRAPADRRGFSAADTLKSAAILLAATAISVAFYNLGFSDANIIMVYILGVLITAIAATHRIYSIVSAAASVIIFNYIFTEPRFTLQAFDRGYPVTFAIMFLAAYITGTLAIRLKNIARQSAQAAYRTKILFDTDQLLNRADSREEIVTALAGQLIKLLNRDVVVYLLEGSGLSEPVLFPSDAPADAGQILSDGERTVAQWAAKNNKHAGATTDTFADARCLYLAIRINNRVYGVVGIEARNRPLDSFEHSVLLSMLGEGALALENEKNAREKEEAAILAKNEQLRANLLRTISHDLRTPLTSISGNASNLISNSASFDESTKRQLYSDIYDDAMWLINLVENLLAVTRIEDGRMSLRRSAELLDEIIAEALQHIDRRSVEHEIEAHSSDEYILVRVDAKLIVQVIINIVDNAIKYTAKGSRIVITSEKDGAWARVRIADDGEGIPEEAREKVFDMFYTGANRVADSRRSLGLGLSLCKSIITAHGGAICAKENSPHGAVFEFTLPAEEVQLHE